MRRRNAMCHQLVMTSFAISACLLVNTAQAATRVAKIPLAIACIKVAKLAQFINNNGDTDYKYCPILAFANHSSVNVKTAQSRAANFSGGFAVAYDLKNYKGKPLRSAYGVANAGTTSKRDLYEGWAYRKNYADGSYVTLGARRQ